MTAHPLNIWMITPLFRPHIGGAERLVETVAVGLARRGHDVTVATSYPSSDLPRRELLDGVEVVRTGIEASRDRKDVTFIAGTLGRAGRVRRRVDVVHAHQMFAPSIIGAVLRPLGGPKLVITPHRGGPEGDIQRLARKIAGHRQTEAFVRLADALVVISDEIRGELLGVGFEPGRLVDIPNGIDTVRFAPVDEAARVAVAGRLGIPTEGRNVLFAGRLVPIKGVDTLLDAVPLLDDDVNLVVAGAGELADRVRAEAAGRLAGRVTFIGPRDDMPAVLSACHGWVLPSRGEGLPLSLLEAMASGLAVVATDVGGIGSVVRDGVNGVMVPVDDAVGLAEGIGRALKQRDVLAGAARATVVESYSAERMIDRHEQLYRNLASR